MKQLLAACAVLAFTASAPPAFAADQNQKAPQPSSAKVPAGSYVLDKSHASLIFKVDHLGFSNYTARFKRFDAQLQFDPANLAASRVNVTIEARSIETDFPDPAKLDFNAELQNEKWLNAAKFPEITFRSTKVNVIGRNKVRIDGELTLRGVTRPMTLHATYNGGYAGHPFDPQARIGFSAHGELKRSEFGISYGVPAPGSKFGVGDAVNVIIEAEFSGPPLAKAAAEQK